MAKSRVKKIVILFLNAFLYCIYGNYLLPILLTSVIAYFMAQKISKNKNFYLIIFSYLIILMPLVFFKYLTNIMSFNILVPLGISYYTLSLISYISDVYHDKYLACQSIIDFMLFSLYFPCLFIGPINKYNDFSKKIKNIKLNKKQLYSSIIRICVGLIKKLIIANKLSVIILSLSNNTEFTGLYILFGCLIYSIFLYCDFSGGIDIVLGVSKIFNVELMENFDKPYLSESIKEFWRRWHISLGTWLKDYIYIPLGGNREGNFKTKFNIIFTFFISGVWHGIHYILWGIINGLLVAINFKTSKKYINIFLTIITISLLWIFFIYNDTFLSIKMFINVFTINGFNIWNLGLNIFDYIVVILTIIPVIFYENKNYVLEKYFNKISIYKKMVIIFILLFLILLLGNYGLDVNSNNFVYGNF